MLLDQGPVQSGGSSNVEYNPIEQDAGVSTAQQFTGDGTQIRGSGHLKTTLTPFEKDVVDGVMGRIEENSRAEMDRLRAIDPSNPELAKPINETEVYRIQAHYAAGFFAGASVAFAIAAVIMQQEATKLKKQSTGVSAEIAIEQGVAARESAKQSAQAQIDGAEKMVDQATAAMVVGIVMGVVQLGLAAMQANAYRQSSNVEGGLQRDANTSELSAGNSQANYEQAAKARADYEASPASANARNANGIDESRVPTDVPTKQQLDQLKLKADKDAAAYADTKALNREKTKTEWDKTSAKAGVYSAVSGALSSISQGIIQRMNAEGTLYNTEGTAKSSILQNAGQDRMNTRDSEQQGQREFDETVKGIIDGLMQALSKYTESVTRLLGGGA